MYSSFLLLNQTYVGCRHWCLKKNKISNFESQNEKLQKTRFLHCCGFNFISFGVFFRVYFKTIHFRDLRVVVVFLPKMAKHDMIKTIFFQTFLNRFSDILMKDVKMMLDKVFKVSR